MLTDRDNRFCGILFFTCAIFLSGCATSPEQAAPVSKAPAKVEVPDNSVAIANLLAAAEKAISADRLMSPVHDNAYDRYQAVLLMEPSNAQAISGLQQVLLRYIALTRSAIARQKWSLANTYLARAARLDASAGLVKELTLSLKQQMAAEAEQRGAQEGVFPLNAKLFARRDASIVAELQAIARRVKSTEETLLIVAPTDADGRWIYSQMKAAVPGFRLRGDIKLGRKVKVVLRTPIDAPRGE